MTILVGFLSERGGWHPQLPILLTPTVISPAFAHGPEIAEGFSNSCGSDEVRDDGFTSFAEVSAVQKSTEIAMDSHFYDCPKLPASR